MKRKTDRTIKDLRLFSQTHLQGTGNRVAPVNDFLEFKKEEIWQSISSRFETQVEKSPDKVAIKVDDTWLTYSELNKRANRLGLEVWERYDERNRLGIQERTRYMRQMMLHGWGIESQERLKGTTVFVAGAGGSGSPLLMQLALAGFGTIIVCDHDEVELSNLNRQVLHDETRIGMNKALSAKQTLQRINPHVNVIAYPEKIFSGNVSRLVGEARVIFDNVDDPEAKFLLSQCAVSKNIPHILSSMIDLNAYVVVLYPPYSPCFFCLYDHQLLSEINILKTRIHDYQRNPNPVAASSLFMSTGFAVNEAIKILLGIGTPAYNKYILFAQRSTADIAQTDGYRQLIYPFTRHFRESSANQGFDWEKGWRGNLLETIQIKPDPMCPQCNNQKLLRGVQGGGFLEKSPPGRRRQEKTDVSHPQTVALLYGHDINMLIGIFGVLKAGKTYVPLDPAYPLERLHYMLEDSESRLIVTDDRHHELAIQLKNRVNKNIQIINIDKTDTAEQEGNLEIPIDPGNIAYILYTSGSTGKPKGVMQSHSHVLHFARVYTNALHLHSGDRLTLFSSYGFDAAKMDIFGALLNGASLYPFTIKQEGSLARMAKWLEDEKITVFHSIPTVYRYFIDNLVENRGTQEKSDNNRGYPHLRFVVMGGEAVYRKDVETYKTYFPDDCIFINGLGPTESTVTLQYFIDKKTEIAKEAVPVGYPVEETNVFLINEKGEEARVFEVGEFIYKSDYLALGYWNNPGLSREAFGRDPLTGDGRVYFSGDLGRRLPDGSIEYVGRKDFQVKVRGYRIELTEIEGNLDQLEGIRKSVVVCRQNPGGETFLTAYYQEEEGVDINENRLVQQLKTIVPDYMVPAAFYRLEEFPLTTTGKIDRKALTEAAVSGKLDLSRVEYASPRNPIEQLLVEIWAEILNIETSSSIGIDDNFFVLGGHSLKATMLVSYIYKRLKVNLPLAEIFNTPTIRGLSGYIKKAETELFISIEAVEKREYYPLSYNQKRLYVIQRVDPHRSSYHISEVIGFQYKMEIEFLKKILSRVFSRHESLRTGFLEVRGEPEPVQFILKPNRVEIPCKFIDISELENEKKDRQLSNILLELATQPFDLEAPPLFRSALIRQGKEDFLFVYILHHIITDGWSMKILRAEFSHLREVLLEGNDTGLDPLKLQYKDFAVWQKRELRNPELREKSHRYWQKKMEVKPVPLKLPYYYNGTQVNRSGSIYQCIVSREILLKLHRLALDHNTTLFMVLFSLYNLLLAFVTGQEEIVLNIINAGRQDLALSNIVGYFVNPVLVKTRVNLEEDFDQLLSRVKADVLEAFQHQNYPLELVLDEMKLEHPEVSAAFNMMNMQDISTGIELESFESYHRRESREVKFEIVLLLTEYKNGIQINWEYQKSLFKPETIETIAGKYIRLMDEVTANPDKDDSGF